MCEHLNKKIALTPELVHYAKEVCADCGKFFKWVKDPATLVWESEFPAKMKSLKFKPVTEWERSFLNSIADAFPRLSPKQKDVFNRICEQYL